jgi:hypothetical protein
MRAGRGWAAPWLCFALALLALVAASPASALPAGRAYERVTPADKNDGDVGGSALGGEFAAALGQSAPDGDSIGYAAMASFGDTQSGELFINYVSRRGSAGWSTHAISPPAAVPPIGIEVPPFRFFSSDLSTGLLEWVSPALAPAAPGFVNLYLRGADGSYRAVIDVTPANVSPVAYDVTFGGASADLSHVVFEANDALTAAAPPADRSVYEWTAAGGLRLVSLLPGPGEVPVPGAVAGDGLQRDFTKAVSEDGSRIFWTAGGGQLYVREDGVRSVQLNASTRVPSLGDGNAILQAITADGSKAIFSNDVALTEAPGDLGGGLYQADLETGSLRDLTPNAAGSPRIQGVLGMSDDGSHVYFVARAVLAEGASAEANNLYLARDGAVEFVATLAGGDESAWSRVLESHSSRVTGDGDAIFLSEASLTGYDNRDAVSGLPDRQLYLYDAAARRLACISCNPSGGRPLGAASLPPGTGPSYLPRVISEDGRRLFFNSADALVAADGNGRQDVYEYENGALSLISSGTSSDISALVEVSPSGRDVFFTTRSRLVAEDRDTEADMYDARLGGGFAAKNSAPLGCAGEACRGPLGAFVPASAPATMWPGDGRAGRAAPRPRCRVGRKAGRKRAAARRGAGKCGARKAGKRR